MRRLLFFLMAFPSLLAATNPVFAETLKTKMNPFSGRPDFYTVLSSVTLPPGSTHYIQNRNTLQSGATFYVSSGTIGGNFYVTGTMTGANITASTNLTISSNVVFGIGSNSIATGSNSTITYHPSPYIRLTNPALSSVSKITTTGVQGGHVLMLDNATGNSITIVNNIDSSGQQIITGTGGNFILPPNGVLFLIYDSNSNHWNAFNGAASSSNFILNTNSLQSGATFFASSGTATNFNAANIKVTGLTANRLVTTDASKNLTSTLVWDKSCSTGTTFPTSPVIGQCFIHNPTGRTIEYRYDGSNWQPIRAFGSSTIYVDATFGSDSIEKGTGTLAGAFQTRQFAFNSIPGSYGGNIVITLGNGTYSEQATIQGKVPTGAFTITEQGTKTTIRTGTAAAAAQGSGVGSAGFGTLRLSGTPLTANAHRSQLIEITGGTGSGYIYVIYSNNNSTFTITGQWVTTPDATSTFSVYSVTGTILSGVGGTQIPTTVGTAQQGFIQQYLSYQNSAFGVYVLAGANADFYYNRFSTTSFYSIYYQALCRGLVYASYFEGGSHEIYVDGHSASPSISYNYISTGSAGGVGIYTQGGIVSTINNNAIEGKDFGIYGSLNSSLVMQDYNDIYGSTTDNIRVLTGSAMVNNNGVAGSTRLRNATGWGLAAASGAVCFGCSGFTYSGNGSGSFDPVTMLAGGVD